MSDPDNLQLLTRATDLFQAQLLAGFLESEGIAARIPDAEMVNAMDGAATTWTAGVRIMVRAADLDQARERLAAWQAERKANREG